MKFLYNTVYFKLNAVLTDVGYILKFLYNTVYFKHLPSDHIHVNQENFYTILSILNLLIM